MPHIPKFRADGTLPEGRHEATWEEVRVRFFEVTGPRRQFLPDFERAMREFADAGCDKLYLGGSFATWNTTPKDYDCAYDHSTMDLDFFRLAYPLLSSSDRHEEQKRVYGGEFYAVDERSRLGVTMLEFFQLANRIPDTTIWLANAGHPDAQRLVKRLMKKKKGIVLIRLR